MISLISFWPPPNDCLAPLIWNSWLRAWYYYTCSYIDDGYYRPRRGRVPTKLRRTNLRRSSACFWNFYARDSSPIKTTALFVQVAHRVQLISCLAR